MVRWDGEGVNRVMIKREKIIQVMVEEIEVERTKVEMRCEHNEQMRVKLMYENEKKRTSYGEDFMIKWVNGRRYKITNYEVNDMNYTNRELASIVDSTKSVVSGNGTSTVITFQTYRVMATAKDGTGANIGHGGDIFYIGIFNQCTPNSDLTWTEVPSARQVLSSPIITTMNDNGDGTYYYDYSVQLDGIITVQVVLKNNGAYSTWYDNNSWSGSPSVYNLSSTIDYNWSSGLITPSSGDFVTAIFKLEIKAPTTDSYTFLHIIWWRLIFLFQWSTSPKYMELI